MEDQTSANTEELEPTSSGTAVASDDADAETIKKNGRTLKLKTHESETSNEAVAEEPTAADSGGQEGVPQGRSRRGRQRRPRRDPNTPSANPMSLTDLKNKATQELIDMAREMGIENMARSSRTSSSHCSSDMPRAARISGAMVF